MDIVATLSDLRPWMTTLFTGGTLVGVLSIRVKSKKNLLDNDEQIRSHWSEEVESLRTAMARSSEQHAQRYDAAERRFIEEKTLITARYEQLLRTADAREQACQIQLSAVREEFRRETAALREEIGGLRGNLAQSSRSALVLAANVPSMSALEAADHAATAIQTLERNERDPAAG